MSLAWLAPLLVFGLVIFVHELGHFLAAKWAGVYTPRFSIGFGPALWRRRRGETEYIIASIPLGGYVRMASKEDEATAFLEGGGEAPRAEASERAATAGPRAAAGDAGRDDSTATARDPHDPRVATAETAKVPGDWDPNAMIPFGPKPIPEHRWFESKPLWKRLIIMLAGETKNVLIAWVVTIGTAGAYGRTHWPAVVDSVVTGRPADLAGFRSGDTIVAINGIPVRDFPEAVERISASPGEQLTVDVGRETRVQLTVRPIADTATNLLTGRTELVGRIGVAPSTELVRVPVGPVEAVTAGTRTTVEMGTLIIRVVRGLVVGEVPMETLGGPIAIAQVSVQAGQAGLEVLLNLIALISVNLAVLNLLPIPILDGGHIVIQLLEAARGRPFSPRAREWIARVGLFIIALLIITVMYNDIARIVRGAIER